MSIMKFQNNMCRMVLAGLGLGSGFAYGQAGNLYTNFIRQVQLPSGVQWDASVASAGEQRSALPIDPGGARFELWTVKATPLTSYLLDTRYISAYIPAADVKITTEDPYSAVPRTRADRPFSVEIQISGLLSGNNVPDPSKSVKLLRHVQSYGSGVGAGIDRSQAILQTQAMVSSNGKLKLDYEVTEIPGSNRSKVRGEERFSIYSLADYQAPESQLAQRYVQIWPVADGLIQGIEPDKVYRHRFPAVTVTVNDLYPDSRTYVQVYPGEPRLGQEGTIIPGSALILNETVPQSRVLTLENYEAAFQTDGRWTMELLTVTPFGIDRLSHVSFSIRRSIRVNSTLSTME
jgi:hypothetical protein